MTNLVRLHILSGKELGDDKREFIFAHVELGRVEDERDDNICGHWDLQIVSIPYIIGD